jgi:hypothetical protein
MDGSAAVIGLFALAGWGAVSVWLSGARIGRRVKRGTTLATRAGLIALVLIVTQWTILRSNPDPILWASVLAAPALAAGITVARLSVRRDIARTRLGRGERW